MKWVDKYKKIDVLVTADCIESVKSGEDFDAEGVGLFRTEWLFTRGDKIELFQRMLTTDTYEEHNQLLEQMLSIQKEYYRQVIRIVKNKPLVIRLLDPPYYYLMHLTKGIFNLIITIINEKEEESEKMSTELKLSVEDCLARLNSWTDFNTIGINII